MKNECRVVGMYDSDAVSEETGLMCLDETRTHEEFAEECDINVIASRFGIGNEMPDISNWVRNIDIVDEVSDFQSAMNILNEAQKQFDGLPAKVRSRFNNSPGEFVNFVSDVGNVDEMIALGLAVKREAKLEGDKPEAQGSS